MSWTHSKDTRVKARKDHRCFICGKRITAGVVYVRRFGFGEDGPENFPMHDECDRYSRLWDRSDWECFSEGECDRSYVEEWLSLQADKGASA